MSALTTADAMQLPAHLAKHFAVAPNTDLTDGAGGGGFPVISYKGKVWAVSKGGNKTILTNSDGDPRASIDVVILKANGALSKNYYATGFTEGSNEKPDCYSTDSVAPASDAASPQATKCAICPKNQWGSRMTDNGTKAKACADSRRMAVAAPEDIEEAMLLRVPAGSLKPLAEYAKALDKRKVPYQAMVTRVGFNPKQRTLSFRSSPSAGWTLLRRTLWSNCRTARRSIPSSPRKVCSMQSLRPRSRSLRTTSCLRAKRPNLLPRSTLCLRSKSKRLSRNLRQSPAPKK